MSSYRLKGLRQAVDAKGNQNLVFAAKAGGTLK
jgi:hypothetical protein